MKAYNVIYSIFLVILLSGVAITGVAQTSDTPERDRLRESGNLYQHPLGFLPALNACNSVRRYDNISIPPQIL